MAHIVAVGIALISTTLFTFKLFPKYNCEKEFVYTSSVKICIIEEKFANAFVSFNSVKNNDTVIFVTKKLIEEFENRNISKEEFEAIIEHEMNHLKKKHLLFIFPINFIVLFVFILFVVEIFVIIIKSIILNKYSIIEFLILLVLFSLNYFVNYSVSIFVKKLELEADNVGEYKKYYLAKALLKLSEINGTPLYFDGKSHPSVEKRIQKLLEER